MVITKLAFSHILLQYNSIPIFNPTERKLVDKLEGNNKLYSTNATLFSLPVICMQYTAVPSLHAFQKTML